MKLNKLTIAMAMSALALPSFAQVINDPPLDNNTRQEIRDAYNKARHEGTVEAWEVFINNYPESLYIEQARKMRDNAIVRSYCTPNTTLERLVAYIDENPTHEPRIRTFYANLVNNPTHSYRYEHMDIGFNGCTGVVREHIELNDGSRPRDNYFKFDDKGLLVEASVMGNRGRARVATYEYSYDNLHGYSLKAVYNQGKPVECDVKYDDNDKLTSLEWGDHKWVCTYNDQGSLVKLVTTTGDVTRTLVYNNGYVIREETGGKVLRYLYDYDSATFKKYLIGVNEIAGGETVHERKVKYDIDSKGRITRAEVTVDGQPYMTLTRTFE